MRHLTPSTLRLPADVDAERGIISMAARGQSRDVFSVLAEAGLPYTLSTHDFTSERRRRQWDVLMLARKLVGDEITPLGLLVAIEALYPETLITGAQYDILGRFEDVGWQPRWKAREYVGRIRDAAERAYLADLALEIVRIVEDPRGTSAQAESLIRQHQAWQSAQGLSVSDTLGTELPL